MIERYIVGNAIDAWLNRDLSILAHQANCHCTMGSGFAKELKERIPKAWEADQQTYIGDVNKLGDYSVYTPDNGVNVVYNLYGQYDYQSRQDTDYDALHSALTGMFLEVMPHDVVGMPKIGSGLGGGSWNVIEGIIDECSGSHPVFIFVLDEKEIPIGGRI